MGDFPSSFLNTFYILENDIYIYLNLEFIGFNLIKQPSIIMGTCSCCCGEKQTKSIEIATDIIKTVERQDKFTQSDMTLSPFSELSNIRKPDELIIISQSPVESEIKSLETLKKVQSLFR